MVGGRLLLDLLHRLLQVTRKHRQAQTDGQTDTEGLYSTNQDP